MFRTLCIIFVLMLTGLGAGLADPALAHGQAETAAAENLEYRLAPGDKIRVVVFGEESLTGDYVIASSGNLSFPLIGNLAATDKTVEGLQTALTTALSDGYLKNPRLTVQIISFRPFFILGEVTRPGEYAVSTGLTVEQAVATAGGYTYRANTRKVFIRRANETAETLVDLRGGSPVVRAGDTIRIAERHF